jgi:hypothetical protein
MKAPALPPEMTLPQMGRHGLFASVAFENRGHDNQWFVEKFPPQRAEIHREVGQGGNGQTTLTTCVVARMTPLKRSVTP